MSAEVERLRGAVRAAFGQAARTLRRLPRPPELAWLEGRGAAWPAILYDRDEHGAWRPPKLRPPGATAKEIDNLDRCLEWVGWLDGEQRRVALARACGFSYRAMAAVNGDGSCMAYHRRWERALTNIVILLLVKKKA